MSVSGVLKLDLSIVTGPLTLAPPTAPSHRSLAIICDLSFVNNGSHEGIVESIKLKIRGADGTRLYTPIAEVDYEKFIQGRRALHAENIRGPFAPFIVLQQNVVKHFFLFSQEEQNKEYPFKEWVPGKYTFELWISSSPMVTKNPVHTDEWDITQKLIDDYFSGTGAVLMK
jgi:hypothetical protein